MNANNGNAARDAYAWWGMTMSVATTAHTVRNFDVDLQELTRMVGEMGGHVERQVVEAAEALAKRDCDRAKMVLASDAKVDLQQRAIEEKAVATIAVRQPLAVDLREIVAVLRLINELERIGDLAKNIGKRVIVLNGGHMPRQSLRGVLHMAGLATAMLHDVLDSYVQRDGDKAFRVWNSDEQVDSLHNSLCRGLLTDMTEDPGIIVAGIHLLFCAKNIERVGDHATNIAEAVYYMVEGRPLGGERPRVDSLTIAAMTSLIPATPARPQLRPKRRHHPAG
jgi:phosphate transport system protein